MVWTLNNVSLFLIFPSVDLFPVTTEDWFEDDKTRKPGTTTESSAEKPANQTLPDSVFKNYDDFYYDVESPKTR